MPLPLSPTFRDRLAGRSPSPVAGQAPNAVEGQPPAPGRARSLIGMWACTGSPLVTEIAAGSGLDWLLIDGEHSANTLDSLQLQLQVVAAYPITPVVRVPWNDPVTI